MANKRKAGTGKLAKQQKKVTVIVEDLAPYKKGDEIQMHPTTAAACVKSKAVKMKGGKAKSE